MRLARVLVPSSALHRWGLIALFLLAAASGCGGDKPSKPLVVNVEPSTATVQVGQTQQFTATVTGMDNQVVTWAVEGGAANGTITASGLYTAPATVPSPASVTVRATSDADPTKSDTAVVTVAPPVMVVVAPATATVQVGQTQQFTATATGTANSAVMWTVDGGFANGVIDALGLYTAPESVPSPAAVTVRATSQADPGRSGTADVTVTPLVTVAVSPPTASLQTGQTQQFTATVTGTANQAVAWSVDGGATNGAIATTGLYIAPDSTTSSLTLVVRATSQADPTKSGTAVVTVSPAISVAVSPSAATVLAGLTLQFAATVTGAANKAVVWSVLGGDAYGRISPTGLYTAPAQPPGSGSALVQATSVADPTKTATASITITGPVHVAVDPDTATVFVGMAKQFAAVITGTPNGAVTWSVFGGTANGTVDSTGLYTAPASVAYTRMTTVQATSVVDPSKSGTARVTVPPVEVAVFPSIATVDGGTAQQFTATVNGTSDKAVTWSIDGGPDNGTIEPSGLYLAPTRVASAIVAIVRATSLADPTRSGTATATVPPVSVTIFPAAATVLVGMTQQFTATVTGATNTAVMWSIDGGTASGTITADGLYTAPATAPSPGTVLVRAVSLADPSKVRTSEVTFPGPMSLVRVPAGSFTMGDGVAFCGTQEHQVMLTRDFSLGQYEVTNQQYREMLQWAYNLGYVAVENVVGSSWDYAVYDRMDGRSGTEIALLSLEANEFSDGVFSLRDNSQALNARCPVWPVSWYGAAAFCDWLSMQAGLPRAYDHQTWTCNGGNPYMAQGYRLPTDAEWEYAAQYDDERIYTWGNSVPDCGRANWGGPTSRCVGRTSPVGSYPAEKMIGGKGLFDMAGNVNEWCNDWYSCDLGAIAVQDPAGPSSGLCRVARGGSFWNAYDSISYLRCAVRDCWDPPNTLSPVGFRVARTVAP